MYIGIGVHFWTRHQIPVFGIFRPDVRHGPNVVLLLTFGLKHTQN
ncbi:22016_t:CDS:2 [Racocetra persica]|uniref:22016_t:CDS:1 n=1 Tax=Racocetra persica TaxID=160502 RepID=A0ACA9KHA5_9GLOM|nr:22016_t:CDS:2 [Racocetra persica]